MAAAAPLALSDLLQRADLWRGDALGQVAEARSTGFEALDAVLPGGGWPQGALTELLLPSAGLGGGLGEVSLLMPALRALNADAGWVVLVAPPWLPQAAAWQAAGQSLSRLLIVEAAGEDAAWASEQLLASGAVAALLSWLPDSDARALRRLQLAMATRRTLAFVFRSEKQARAASPAPLRIALNAADSGLALQVVKRRGPPLAQAVRLQVARPVSWARLAARHPLGVQASPGVNLARSPARARLPALVGAAALKR
ncbi:translesion DNA synthesis-associated protein ImuA [Niveibacterium sp. 24ML]|uniref:translesion DNA synthesis-associated protein ImuA n=1 Tax=Niveibacterium sp. 24ML TaxID=2985512 RepID=UPI002270B314|nr:translesion DNA synthesis-associated protein ImuA [Niveibacterium sp. 24ML]MCX9155336.1 translesion DNA synthesis-associated protein ImuA [Niveibacterium sp. 24ML]